MAAEKGCPSSRVEDHTRDGSESFLPRKARIPGTRDLVFGCCYFPNMDGGGRQGGGGARPQDPFAQLTRCHRRLKEAISALRTAAATRDLETASDVSAFFARQIRRHEEDEERSLFPRLLAADAPELHARLARLATEHRHHAELHEQLERAVAGRDDEPGGGDPWHALSRLADELAETYRAHIEEEETSVFPAARDLLSPTALEAIVTEMEARRGR